MSHDQPYDELRQNRGYVEGQKVYAVEWTDGRPEIVVGTVTRVSTQAYYVDHAKKKSFGWYPSVELAIEAEHDWWFAQRGFFVPKERHRTVKEIVSATIALAALAKDLR